MKPDAGVIRNHVDLYSVEDDSSTVNLEERCICSFDRFLNFLSVGLRFFGEFFPWAVEYRDRRNDWRDGFPSSFTIIISCTARSPDPVFFQEL